MRNCAVLQRLLLLAVVAAAALVTACASSGAVPRPRPFPGASLPPLAPPHEPAPEVAGPVASPVIATAMTFLGTPYRFAGSDPSGFDCSGFVQWVFARHGVALPREVRDQYRVGSEIEADEVRAGDLVFFETVARGASHVGIALGGGEFVHAPSSRGVVRVERYTGSYWGPRYVGARRVRAATLETR